MISSKIEKLYTDYFEVQHFQTSWGMRGWCMYSYSRNAALAYFSPMYQAMTVCQGWGRSSLLICIMEETVRVSGRQKKEAEELGMGSLLLTQLKHFYFQGLTQAKQVNQVWISSRKLLQYISSPPKMTTGRELKFFKIIYLPGYINVT